METTPKTDGQEKHHDETGEKRSKTKAKDDGTRRSETYWANKEGKEDCHGAPLGEGYGSFTLEADEPTDVWREGLRIYNSSNRRT